MPRSARTVAFAAFGAAAMLAAALAAAPAGAQSSANSSARMLAKYPVAKTYKGPNKPVDLKSHRRARRFRTRLREAAKERPNFAGRFIVTAWGCGTSCQMIAMIDASNGKVHFGPAAETGFVTRLNSRLLIVNPEEEIREAYDKLGLKRPSWLKTRYFLWAEAEGRLKPLTLP